MSPRTIRRFRLPSVVIALLLLTLLPVQLSAAPAPVDDGQPWLLQFGTAADDTPTALAITPAGQLVVAGYTEGVLDDSGGSSVATVENSSDTAGSPALWVATYDLAGNRQWLKQFGRGLSMGIAAVAVDPSGQIYVAGSSGARLFADDKDCTAAPGQSADSSNSDDPGTPENSGAEGSFLLALHAAGEPLWHCYEPGQTFLALAADDVSVYAAGGARVVTVEGDDIPLQPARVYAFARDGRSRWLREIGEEGASAASTAIVLDGKLTVGGVIVRPPVSSPKKLLWNAQLDGEGNIIRQAEIPLSAPEYLAAPAHTAIAPTGLPIMVGAAFDLSGDIERSVGWWAQLNANVDGQEHWALREFRTGADSETVNGIAASGEGRYWLSGTQAAFGDTIQRIPQIEDAWLAEIGSMGTARWITAFGTPRAESITAPVAGSDGSLYVAGSSEGDLGGPNAGDSDAWIMKVRFNEIGLPQFADSLAGVTIPSLSADIPIPMGNAPVPEAPQSDYSSLAGTIVFAADPAAQGPMHGSMSPTHQLYAVQPDGSGLVQITHDAIFPWQTAAVAPDGMQIAVSSCDTSPIRFLDTRGNTVAEVQHPGKRAHALEWSPMGDAVLFLVVEDLDDGSEDQDLWQLSIPDKKWTQITSDDAVKEWDASWSPDGSRIAAERDTQLWVMDAGGGNEQQLGSQTIRFVAWSPDGKTIAYESLAPADEAENWDIWAVDADGANPRNLTNDPSWYEVNPAWSPDGRSLIYNASSTLDGPSAIWILDVASGEKRKVIDKGDNVQPIWVAGTVTSTAGTGAGQPGSGEAQGAARLALETAGFILDGSLWTIQADGSGLRRLTNPEKDGTVSAFTWADDGSALAFIAQKEGEPPALLRMDMPAAAVTSSVTGNLTSTLPGPAAATLTTLLDDIKLGKLAWSGSKIVLLSRDPAPEQNASYVFEDELTIIDLGVDPPVQTSVRNSWQILASEAGPYSYVTISPDGQWVYFADANVSGLATMDGAPVDIRPSEAPYWAFVQWKADPTALTFTQYDDESNPPGERAYQLVPETGEVSALFGAPALYVHFTSDGQWAAIADPNLKLLDADGEQTRLLSSVRAADLRWSPWGDALLYRRTVADPELFGASKMAPELEKPVGYDVITVDGKYHQILLPNDVEALAWRPLAAADAALYRPPTRKSLATLPLVAVQQAIGNTGGTAAAGAANTQAGEIGVVAAEPLNFRAAPSTGAKVIDQLKQGTQVVILERSSDGQWLRVRIPRGLEGWVSAEFVTLGAQGDAPAGGAEGSSAASASVQIDACTTSTDQRLIAHWDQATLGCATAPAAYVWAAWQAFERGAMLWREDTHRIYVLGGDGTWSSTADVWDGSPLSGRRGAPPTSRQAPERGIGYVWENDDSIFNTLGWAVDKERGTCVLLQKFEASELLRSTGSGCDNGLYSHGQELGFSLQYLALLKSGGYVR